MKQKIKDVKVKVKCIACGFIKEIGKEEGKILTQDKSIPTCDKCFSPMIAVKAVI